MNCKAWPKRSAQGLTFIGAGDEEMTTARCREGATDRRQPMAVGIGLHDRAGLSATGTRIEGLPIFGNPGKVDTCPRLVAHELATLGERAAAVTVTAQVAAIFNRTPAGRRPASHRTG